MAEENAGKRDDAEIEDEEHQEARPHGRERAELDLETVLRDVEERGLDEADEHVLTAGDGDEEVQGLAAVHRGSFSTQEEVERAVLPQGEAPQGEAVVDEQIFVPAETEAPFAGLAEAGGATELRARGGETVEPRPATADSGGGAAAPAADRPAGPPTASEPGGGAEAAALTPFTFSEPVVESAPIVEAADTEISEEIPADQPEPASPASPVASPPVSGPVSPPSSEPASEPASGSGSQPAIDMEAAMPWLTVADVDAAAEPAAGVELQGGRGDDLLSGGAGDDRLHGGQGDDVLYGDADLGRVGAALDIAAGLGDLDGSETLAITLSGLPDGALLSAGTDLGNGTWSLAPEDLPGLTLDLPAGTEGPLTIIATATATETGGAVPDTAGISRSFEIALPDVGTLGGDDDMFGGEGDDSLFGGGGADRLTGGAGEDLLVGGAGDDLLRGGQGDDILLGGAGDDDMRGEAGNDRFEIGADGGHDSVDGGGGNWTDVLDISEAAIASSWVARVDTDGDGVADLVIASGDVGEHGTFDLGGHAAGIVSFDSGDQVTFEDVETLVW